MGELHIGDAHFEGQAFIEPTSCKIRASHPLRTLSLHAWERNSLREDVTTHQRSLVKRAERSGVSTLPPTSPPSVSPVFSTRGQACVSRARCPSCEISIKARSFKNCPLSRYRLCSWDRIELRKWGSSGIRDPIS